MKKTLTISVLSALVLCGCQKEELTFEKTTEQKTFTAEIESNSDGVATKTSLSPSDQSNQFNVVWSTGDEVSIFAGSTVNAQYQVAEAGKTSATLNHVSSESVSGDAISANVAYYPYSNVTLATTETGYTISGITLPVTQTYAQASFASGAFPMAAVTASKDDNSLKFKNILGGLKLQLTGTAKVRSISVSGNNGEILCGSATVTVSSSADPSITLSESTATTVTLDCGESGVQLNEDTATPFIIALPPMTFSNGFTVTVTDTDGYTMDISTAKSKVIKRSTILPMKAVKFAGEGPSLNEPFTLTSVGSTSVAFEVEDATCEPEYTISLEYSINDGEWTAYTVGNSIDLTDGDRVSFRSSKEDNKFSDRYGNYIVSVSGDGKISVSGDICYLLNKSAEAVTSYENGVFYHLFYECEHLTDASKLKLPDFTADHCYTDMFYGCTSLTAAPALPAETLTEACYYEMFDGCKSLISTPTLSAKTLAKSCCYSMFNSCKSLTTAPDILPAETLAENCYTSMFRNCSSLEKAPVLPAKTLVTECYEQMFERCEKLNYIKALFTTAPSTDFMTNWVKNVASAGTFVMSKDAEWTAADNTGTSGIPSGWTVQTE